MTWVIAHDTDGKEVPVNLDNVCACLVPKEVKTGKVVTGYDCPVQFIGQTASQANIFREKSWRVFWRALGIPGC